MPATQHATFVLELVLVLETHRIRWLDYEHEHGNLRAGTSYPYSHLCSSVFICGFLFWTGLNWDGSV